MKRITMILMLFILSPCFGQIFEKVDGPVSKDSNASRAAGFIDLNQDGWSDILITNGKKGGEDNQAFINKKGDFIEASLWSADDCPSDGFSIGDIDNDGLPDVYVVNWYGQKNLFYEGKKRGKYKQIMKGDIIQSGFSETASYGDYDNDGFLDLYITNSHRSSNYLLKNERGRSFKRIENILTASRLETRNVSWIDFDQDGDLDVFLTNEANQKNQFFIQEKGEFIMVHKLPMVQDQFSSCSSNWVDYDNDGDFDLYVTNIDGQNNNLYRKEDADFIKVKDLAIVQDGNSGFGSTWGDIDNDGDLDLYVTNAYTSGPTFNGLYLNNGDGTFDIVKEDVSVKEPGWSYGAALGDYNQDGYLDMVVSRTFNEGQTNQLFRNRGGPNNWLQLNLIGTKSNRMAIGAIITLVAEIGDKKVTMVRDISGQHGYNCYNSPIVHFGLGSAERVLSIKIDWPSGHQQRLDLVEANQILQITESAP